MADVPLGRCDQLRKQLGATLNGACDQLWEKCQIGGEGNEAIGGLDFLVLDINDITNGLERVKRDAHRQNDVGEGPARGQAELLHQATNGVGKEIEILEETQ